MRYDGDPRAVAGGAAQDQLCRESSAQVALDGESDARDGFKDGTFAG